MVTDHFNWDMFKAWNQSSKFILNQQKLFLQIHHSKCFPVSLFNSFSVVINTIKSMLLMPAMVGKLSSERKQALE